MSSTVTLILVFLLGAATGTGAYLVIQSRLRRNRLTAAREKAASIVQRAQKEAESRLEAAALEAKLHVEAAEAKLEEDYQAKSRDVEEARQEVERRDKDLRRRIAYTDERLADIEKRQETIAAQEAQTTEALAEAQQTLSRQRTQLEKIAGYSADQARAELRQEMELDARREAAASIIRIQEEARERANDEARWITAQAMQRIPLSQYAESTVSVVHLPNDEMKGRIIGREGRNIRAIEMGCGIDLIIDDTPGTIILSSFDPTRRMIAKIAIDKLIEDGRIHPARIEEVIQKTREEFDATMAEQGEAAAFELGLHDLNARLFKMIGRLQYMTHHGQNLLDHSREVAMLATHMAGMLNADSEVTRRAGLLHKIGFSDETNQDVSPLILSSDLAQRMGEPEAVIHCIQALYGVVAPRTVEAVLLQVAENAVAHRPGAQKSMLQDFLQQLGQLEEIARSFKGVKEAFAVRAGKEVRVIVHADQVTDKEAVWLSKDISARIEKECEYPGQLRVSVIRETRSVGFAM